MAFDIDISHEDGAQEMFDMYRDPKSAGIPQIVRVRGGRVVARVLGSRDKTSDLIVALEETHADNRQFHSNFRSNLAAHMSNGRCCCGSRL